MNVVIPAGQYSGLDHDDKIMNVSVQSPKQDLSEKVEPSPLRASGACAPRSDI